MLELLSQSQLGFQLRDFSEMRISLRSFDDSGVDAFEQSEFVGGYFCGCHFRLAAHRSGSRFNESRKSLRACEDIASAQSDRLKLDATNAA